MKKCKRKICSLVMAVMVLFSSVNISAFAAGNIDGSNKTAYKTAGISLYQNGALGAAYEDGDDLSGIYNLTEGTAEAAIYEGLKNMESSINIASFHLSTAEAVNLYRQVINGNPDLFFVSDEVSYSYDPDKGECLYFNPSYIAAKSEIETMSVSFKAASEAALEGITTGMSDLDKALYLHDYLVKLNTYDQDNYLANTVPAVSHSAYGCLVLGVSVCDGYALAYSYLLKQVGIEAHLISGPGHAWNAVKLNGNYYFVDLTWDDPVGSHGSDMFDYVGHSYFLLTGNEIKADGYSSHSSWDQNISATDTTYSNAAFRGVTGAYGYYDGYWYYWHYENNNSEKPVIAKTSNPVNAGTKFYSLSHKWYVYGGSGSYFQGYFGGTDVDYKTGKLYFSSTKTIYSIDLNNDTVEAVSFYEIDSNAAGGYLCGLKVLGRNLYIGIAPDVNTKEDIYYIELEEPEAEGIEVVTGKDQTEQEFLYSGETYQLEAKPVNGEFKNDITWSSSAESVATVDENGCVTAIAPGTVTITAEYGSLSDDITIEVKQAVTGLTAAAVSVSTAKGESVTLTIKPENDTQLRKSDIKWILPESENILKAAETENTDAAQMTVNGISGGKAEVKVTFKEFTYTFTVTVTSAFTGFSFDKTEVTIGKNTTSKLKITLEPADAYPVPEAEWSSSAPEIVSVDGEGTINGLSVGEAVIYCTIDGVTHSVTVKVGEFIQGDADNNGEVTAEDALAVLKNVAHMQLDVFNEAAADCDGTPGISAEDALWILKKVAHMI